MAGDHRRRDMNGDMGMKECAGHTGPWGFYSKHTGEIAIAGEFYAGE